MENFVSVLARISYFAFQPALFSQNIVQFARVVAVKFVDGDRIIVYN